MPGNLFIYPAMPLSVNVTLSWRILMTSFYWISILKCARCLRKQTNKKTYELVLSWIREAIWNNLDNCNELNFVLFVAAINISDLWLIRTGNKDNSSTCQFNCMWKVERFLIAFKIKVSFTWKEYSSKQVCLWYFHIVFKMSAHLHTLA